MTLSCDPLQEPWFVELRAEWNETLERTDVFARGGRDKFLPLPNSGATKPGITVDQIVKAVAKETGILASHIVGGRHNKRVVAARWVAMLIADEALPCVSIAALASRFNRDHSTMEKALPRAADLIKNDESFRALHRRTKLALGLS